MKTLKPTIRVLDARVAKQGAAEQRITGNTRVAVIKRLARERPRLCAECYRSGMVRLGQELDHIVPLWSGGSNDECNLQWLCKPCHADKTAREAAERAGGRSISGSGSRRTPPPKPRGEFSALEDLFKWQE